MPALRCPMVRRPPPRPSPTQPNQTPEWYKDSPQAYDHRTAKPRHLHAQGKQLQIYDDTPPARQVAQEEPPQQEAQPYPAQPYSNQPSPHVQNVPRYYGQPDPQAEAAPQPQQGYPQQGYPQQNYPQQQQNDPQDYASQGAQDYPQDDYGPSAGQPGQPTQQPLAPEQLEQLVAPIALYPDQLVAQILTASTYPAQITAADQMVRSMNGAPPEQIAQSAGAQTSWDPSIKALTAFPQVLAMLDGNLQWTAGLGNAYYNQPQDVLETIQVLRERAQQSGNLQSTPQEQIVQQPNYIQIQPADPQYIYVPSYNPWYVYGAPIAPYPTFAFGTSGLYIGGGVEYGLGFAVAPFFRFPYFSAWGCDWRGGGVLFNHGSYWSHSHEVHDWGFAHGGRRWDGGHGGSYGGYGGRESARFGNYHNQPLDVHNGNGFNRSPMGRGFGGPQQPFAGRPQQGFGHLEGGGPMRPQAPGQQAYGRMPPAIGRPEPFQGRMQPYGGQPFTGRPPMAGGPQNFGGRPRTVPRPMPAPSPMPPVRSSSPRCRVPATATAATAAMPIRARVPWAAPLRLKLGAPRSRTTRPAHLAADQADGVLPVRSSPAATPSTVAAATPSAAAPLRTAVVAGTHSAAAPPLMAAAVTLSAVEAIPTAEVAEATPMAAEAGTPPVAVTPAEATTASPCMMRVPQVSRIWRPGRDLTTAIWPWHHHSVSAQCVIPNPRHERVAIPAARRNDPSKSPLSAK